MTHFGILCPTATGHLNPMSTLGRELQQRGHRVTLFQLLDVERTVRTAGLEFCAIATAEQPLGSVAIAYQKLGELNGLAALRYTVQLFQNAMEAVLREAPEAMRQVGIEALIVDQVTYEGGTVADVLNIPYVTVAGALNVRRETGVPPFMVGWNYSPAPWARWRNQAAYALLDQLGNSLATTVQRYRHAQGLPAYTDGNQAYSRLAEICQQPAEFEFPRRELPPHFHFVGPLHDDRTREPIPFPYEKLTGAPLVYASMGTLQNRQAAIFQAIAAACEDLPVQLAIALGQPQLEALPTLPGAPIIVAYAPQLELLKRAALTVTHAGLNTVLESLSNGVPMVALPITNDQPGVAARLVWAGAGEKLSPNRLSVPKLRAAIQRVLTQPTYRQNAQRLQTAIGKTGGAAQAADIIEQAIATRQPVLNPLHPAVGGSIDLGTMPKRSSNR